jgi:hypothetical protein
MCAAYNEDVYRVSVTYNLTSGGAPQPTLVSADFWYHVKLQAWSGPHSFPARAIIPTDLPGTSHGYLIVPLLPPTPSSEWGSMVWGVGKWAPSGGSQAGSIWGEMQWGVGEWQPVSSGPGATGGVWGQMVWGVGRWGEPGSPGLPGQPGQPTGVWFSNTRPLINSTYVENGTPLGWALQTSLWPDTGAMFQNAMCESALAISLPVSGRADIIATNEVGTILDINSISGFSTANVPPTTPWGPGTTGALFAQRQIPWHQDLVFKQAQITVSGPSDPSVAIGNLYLRYQRTGYMLQELSLVS